MNDQRLALVVAIDRYDNPALRRLAAPTADAEALAEVLGDPDLGGFDVDILSNATSWTTLQRVEDLLVDRRPSDLVVLHFSCHGLKSDSGELYLASTNTVPERLGSTAIEAIWINRIMQRSRAQRIVLLLDCCYGGAFERGLIARAGGDIDISDQFRQGELGEGRGRAVITASTAMEYAFEGSQMADGELSGPSIFTSALVEGIRTGEADRDQDGYITLDELYNYVYNRVREHSPNQTPCKWEFGLRGGLYIARNPHRRIRPAPLPQELLDLVEHPATAARLAAVDELAHLAVSANLPRAAAARLALTRLGHDDSRRVSTAAAEALERTAVRLTTSTIDFGRVPPGRPPLIAEVNVEGGPLALASTVTTSTNALRARLDADTLRITWTPEKAGSLNATVTLTGPAGETHLRVAAEIVKHHSLSDTPPKKTLTPPEKTSLLAAPPLRPVSTTTPTTATPSTSTSENPISPVGSTAGKPRPPQSLPLSTSAHLNATIDHARVPARLASTWDLRRLTRNPIVFVTSAIIFAAVVVIIVITAVPFETNSAQYGPAGAVPAGLERFYGQSLSWTGCSSFAQAPQEKSAYADSNLQCAYVNMPLDYANPNGRVIKIGLLRRPASDHAGRIGSLIINPGGPGQSGMSTAASLIGDVTSNDIGKRFDFVGFDPRGVGSSEPQVLCRTRETRDAERLMNLNVDSSPEGVTKTENQEKADVEGCITRTGKDVLANIGTREVARDLDVIRSVLGDEKLTYLGYSYGTRIGVGYAEAFPQNVRALILDGAVDPEQDQISQLIEQGRGFQKAFDVFAAWCTEQPECGLGKDKAQTVARFQALVRPLINQPAALADGRKMSYTDATIGTVQALYVSRLWPTLNLGLQQLAQGRTNADCQALNSGITCLMRLVDIYYGREDDGSYSTQMDVFQAVHCVDDPAIKDRNVAREVDAQHRKVAPFLDNGQPPSPALDNCAFWPVPPTDGPHRPQARGLPTVVVISTTQDPVTPYQAGVNLAGDIKARLLTFEGTRHTAFLQGNSCIDRAGINYLVTLELPAEGTRCKSTN